MNREDILRMAREAELYEDGQFFVCKHEELGRFAALVEAHVNAKEKERQRYDIHSCGPDCDRYICVAVRKAREEEREACAGECDKWSKRDDDIGAFIGRAIRERGNT